MQHLCAQKSQTHVKDAFLGATLRLIQTGNEEGGFLTANAVQAFAAQEHYPVSPLLSSSRSQLPKRLGLEAVVPRAFLVENALSPQICNVMIHACEAKCFGQYSIGKNNHVAMQVLVFNQGHKK